MSEITRDDLPKEEKAAMVKLLLDRGADMFAEDNVSAIGMCMRPFGCVRREVD